MITLVSNTMKIKLNNLGKFLFTWGMRVVIGYLLFLLSVFVIGLILELAPYYKELWGY